MLTWQELRGRSNEQLAPLDIAENNLACAAGLPDAGNIDVAECINRLNHYAKSGAHFTETQLPEFRKRPEVYDGSEAIFRMVCLVRLLQKQFGVIYNPAKIPDDAPFNTADVFIHGALLGEGGTCASLPVVYAAVGRRLGYPLKLVAHLQHCFLRWDDPKGERINIEINNTGMNAPPDQYYRTGRYEVSDVVVRCGCLLKSMTPREELSGFLAGRGHRWLDLGRDRQAVDSFAWAWALQPENGLLQNRLARTMNDWAARLRALQPPGYPQMYFTWPPRRFPDTFPLDFERNILLLEAWENTLKNPEHEERWWGPLRSGMLLMYKPKKAVIVFNPSGCEIGLHFN